jgi:nitroimidazol reductase NimA-like FMN-containing flavoprotein (pyridoxamine 5'-phosphate oxidase superfamily)
MFDTDMLVDEGLELLTEERCWELLSGAEVGRVGVTVGALPAIFPVNHVVIDRGIVFRTAPGAKLAAATAGAIVAFEADDYRAADRSGWSVLAVGPAEVVHDLDVTFKALGTHLTPWAGGTRTSIVRVTPEFVSGRRLVRH